MKRTLFLSILIISFTALKLQAQSIKDLDFLIGTWETEETIFPGTDRAYKEHGIRTCSYFMNDAFIKCESVTKVSTSGKERHYGYYITWNQMDGFFQAVSLAHDFPRPGIHQWYLDQDKKIITMVSPQNVVGDRFFRASLSFADPNVLIWEGWRSKFSEDKAWTQVYRDVARKQQ